MKSWKKLGTKQLLDHPRLSVYEDDVQLPNGHTTKYLKFGTTGGVAFIIAQNDSGEILVQKEYSYPTDASDYHFPAGAVHMGEDPKVGAAREFAEEASLQGDLAELGWFHAYNRRTADRSYVYAATSLRPAQALQDPEESIEHQWLTPQQIDALIAGGNIHNQGFLAAWCLFKAHRLAKNK